ncbi:putative aminodeoxychorismate lyase [Enhygromyxa salina]|uniref:Endolytic murein transglycosylase n=1 Tax=Enhygromyxa salina TaxID=215803 RepID=A0A2S9YG92_9BACT|nr:endolytic transglycosylase MltG [Enhygromyxa salina]PRQ04123.1 putative aminodeoxychorismate lyase [Enhygromyxa salina]
MSRGVRKPRPWYKPRKSRRASRWALAVIVSLLLLAVLSARAGYKRLTGYPERPGQGSSDPITVTVPAGASFSEVLALLEEHEVIAPDEARAFKLFVLHRGAASKVTAGEHEFRGDMTPTQILDELQRRQPVQERRVTIPEGKHSVQIAQILAEAGLGGGEAQLLAAMRDPELLARLDIEGPSAEGYLFPDTYKFSTSASAAQIVERMVKRHHQVYAELRRGHSEGARSLAETLGWGDPEIVIMASLIEKETSQGAERPRIASVFINRLRFKSFKPKLLQTDPTIIYGCTVPERRSEACQQFEGRIRRIHLRDKDNPYNTYTHEGLPPGPISNPGRDALEAVLAPEKSRYLYFVSRNDGTHKFSKSVQEHEAAVNKYILGGAKGDGSVQK